LECLFAKTCGRCEWCQRGKRIFCEQQQGTGVTLHGGHAEYMLAYEDATMLIPNEISQTSCTYILRWLYCI
jgi:D-arabinose 1-dehydrogenase-like Zn-dependent alcohol dehydrogenase